MSQPAQPQPALSFSSRLTTLFKVVHNGAVRNDPDTLNMAVGEMDRIAAEADALRAKYEELEKAQTESAKVKK